MNLEEAQSDNLELLSFQQTLGLKSWAKEVMRKMSQGDNRNYYHSSSLRSMLQHSDKFPLPLNELSNISTAEVKVFVHWKFKGYKSVRDRFYNELCLVFDQDKSDQNGIKYVLGQSDTIIISIQVRNVITEKEFVASLVSFTTFYDGTKCKFSLVILTLGKTPKVIEL